MKSMIVSFILSTSFFAFADDNANSYLNYTDVTENKAAYVEALLYAATNKSFYECSNKSADNGNLIGNIDYLRNAQRIYVTSYGQPAIVAMFSMNQPTSYEWFFETTSDYKTLTAFSWKSFKTVRVNEGTLINPNFVVKKVLDAESRCTIQ